MFEQLSTFGVYDDGKLQHIFKLLPSFIERLILPLSKCGDLIPYTCRLTKRKELGKEGLDALIVSGYRLRM